jgi:N-acetylated-alpha-linked acidic dipeptidase
VLALRLANADILPFDFGFYGRDISIFLKELYGAGRKPAAPGCVSADLNLTSAIQHAEEFAAAGAELKSATEAALAAGKLDAVQTAALNRVIMDVESNWLNSQGIPGRPWFKHIIYAARYTYAHLELPGITEAVENHNWQTARQQTAILENALAKNTALLRQAAMRLKGAR